MEPYIEIKKLYEDGTIKKIANQIGGQEYGEDLAQEIVLILLEKNEKIISKLLEEKAIKFYIVGIATNLFRSNNSEFQKKYRHNEIKEQISNQYNQPDDPYNSNIDDLYQKALQEMDTWANPNQYPYDKKLFLLYLELGSKKSIERKTGIPYRSIIYTIENCKQKLKNALQSDYDYFINYHGHISNL